MANTKPGRVLLVLLASAFGFSAFLAGRSECAAASAANPIRITSPAAGEVLADWKALVKGELTVPEIRRKVE